MAQLTVPIFDKDDLQEIVDGAVKEIRTKFVLKKTIEEAMDEIKTERDKSYECEALGHGWGLQSALEILQKHLGEEYEGY